MRLGLESPTIYWYSFMDRVEAFLKEELGRHISLEDAIYGAQRRAAEKALKEGTAIPLGLLSPTDPVPFKRGRERLNRALAALTARQ